MDESCQKNRAIENEQAEKKKKNNLTSKMNTKQKKTSRKKTKFRLLTQNKRAIYIRTSKDVQSANSANFVTQTTENIPNPYLSKF